MIKILRKKKKKKKQIYPVLPHKNLKTILIVLKSANFEYMGSSDISYLTSYPIFQSNIMCLFLFSNKLYPMVIQYQKVIINRPITS